jgi:dTDP-4-dehydrorhamnose reductase
MTVEALRAFTRPVLWAGVECTLNRVGDQFFDQLERNGHAERLDDLDRFAALGIRALRYPLLWERTAPDGLTHADWSWPDARLARLRELNITPIVGLVHHGSGPRHTSLVDAAFPEQLAAYAGAVAQRYPWLIDYTPINEPLTTARFAGLYGHWYPHGRDDHTFIRALLVQCRAIVLAMQAIRAVNPQARLIQTEDMGKTWSTPSVAYQADFENARRWLSLDLLCGRVDKQHPLWGYVRDAGADVSTLDWFRAHPCPPDIVGINTYLTSERWLDHRLDLYPEWTHPDQARSDYVDVAAVHVLEHGIAGHAGLLREAWERYHLPLAITETHLGCTREEQLRWLLESWDAACLLRREGVPVEAVTVWALLGAYDWNSLVTRQAGYYEPGAFDLRAPAPRPTALATLLRDLAHGQVPDHPLLAQPGWWRRPQRFFFGSGLDIRNQAERAATAPRFQLNNYHASPRPLLIIGATGTLGSAFVRVCEVRGIAVAAPRRQELPIADEAAIEAALARYQPWAVVNAAGYVRVDDAEREPELCFRGNTHGPALLAAACARHELPLLTFSSDLVFDGAQQVPYVEHDPVAPLNVYGRSKAAAERLVLTTLPRALVVRTSAFFGPWDDYNFITQTLRALHAGELVVAPSDAVVSPTYVPDLVQASLDLLIDGEHGIWHLANDGALSWADLARCVAGFAGYALTQVEGQPSASLGGAAAQPPYSVLGSVRGNIMPPLDDALMRYLEAVAPLLSMQSDGDLRVYERGA